MTIVSSEYNCLAFKNLYTSRIFHFHLPEVRYIILVLK